MRRTVPAISPPAIASPFLDTAGAAKFLHVSIRTLERWRVTGEGPAFRKHGKTVCYSTPDLVAYSDSRVRRSTAEAA